MKKLQLLSDGRNNHKIGKNGIESIRIYSLNLRPFKTLVNGVVKNVCPFAGKCSRICVGDNGHFSMRNGPAYKAQLRKTELFFNDTQKFMDILFSEIKETYNFCLNKNIVPVYRLNAYSDLNWRKLTQRYLNENIFETFTNAIFYDYTKDYKKVIENKDSNYSVTYSYNELSDNANVKNLLDNGGNVAVIFEKLPETFLGYKVIDGDLTDNRFLDEKGTIVGLKFKGSKKELLQSIADGLTIPNFC